MINYHHISSFCFSINITGYNHLKLRRNPYVYWDSNYFQSYPITTIACICLVPMALSLPHEHWAPWGFAGCFSPLISVVPLISYDLGCLDHMMLTELTHRIPELTQMFLQNLLFLEKMFTSMKLILWSVIHHPHHFGHNSFSYLPFCHLRIKMASIFNCLVLFCFALQRRLFVNSRKKICSIFFEK